MKCLSVCVCVCVCECERERERERRGGREGGRVLSRYVNDVIVLIMCHTLVDTIVLMCVCV